MTVELGFKQNHWLFTPPVPYIKLNNQDKKTVEYLEKHVHGIPYSSGNVDYSQINIVLEWLLHASDYIYVRGNQKADFLLKKCQIIGVWPVIVDTVKFDGTPCATETFINDSNPSCSSHANGPFNCTQKNVEKLSLWFKNTILPM